LDSADFDALEQQAKAKLSPAAYAFAAAGADDEITLADNIAAWRRLRLRPRMLNDVSKIDTGVTVLGRRLAAPIMVAPFGRHKLFHPEGERATARGAVSAGAGAAGGAGGAAGCDAHPAMSTAIATVAAAQDPIALTRSLAMCLLPPVEP